MQEGDLFRVECIDWTGGQIKGAAARRGVARLHCLRACGGRRLRHAKNKANGGCGGQHSLTAPPRPLTQTQTDNDDASDMKSVDLSVIHWLSGPIRVRSWSVAGARARAGGGAACWACGTPAGLQGWQWRASGRAPALPC